MAKPNLVLPPIGGMKDRPIDVFTKNLIKNPSGFRNTEDYYYLFIKNSNLIKYEEGEIKDYSNHEGVILIMYPKHLKVYYDKVNNLLYFNYTTNPTNFIGWANVNCTGVNWRQPFYYADEGIYLGELDIFTEDSLRINMYGTGVVYTDDNYTHALLNYGSDFSEFYNDFIPDAGTSADLGGGNQNWGQGSPVVNTALGTFDNTSDIIGLGDNYSTKTGMLFNNYYVLNRAELAEIKKKIWGVSLPFFTKPNEAIISIMAYPNMITNLISTEGNFVKVGNTAIEISEGNVDVLPANVQNTLTLGNIKLEPYFGGFQDYAPYTKIKIWLPFIGYRDLDPHYVQGKNLEVRYVINYTNGSCIVLLFSDDVIISRYNGQLGQAIPLQQVNNGLLEATMSTAIQTAAMTTINPALGVANLAKEVPSALSNIVNSRPNISGSAGGGGEAEWSLPLEAFLLIERPNCVISQTYNHENGRPSLVNKQLSKCRGFTSMVDPKVTANCTQTENDRINMMLKEGVIINGKA